MLDLQDQWDLKDPKAHAASLEQQGFLAPLVLMASLVQLARMVPLVLLVKREQLVQLA